MCYLQNTDITAFIASDHSGVYLKTEIIMFLKNQLGIHLIEDCGCNADDGNVDYSDYGLIVANAVLLSPKNVGILICGTGIGMSICANRFSGIRAALCTSVEAATLARMHNDANILCLGARCLENDEVFKIVKAFFLSKFENGRHLERIRKLDKLNS